MHQIKVAEVSGSEKKLTQAVLQITQMPGIYQAELARILCADIGGLSNEAVEKHTAYNLVKK